MCNCSAEDVTSRKVTIFEQEPQIICSLRLSGGEIFVKDMKGLKQHREGIVTPKRFAMPRVNFAKRLF